MNSIVPSDQTEIDLSRLTRSNMEASIRGYLADLDATGNMRRTVQVLKALEQFQDISGFGRAQLLHGMKAWATKNDKLQTFYTDAGLDTPGSQVYADRLINLWQNIEDDKFPKDILKRQVRDLLPISIQLSQGVEFNEDEWNDLRMCTDSVEIQLTINKILKRPARKNTLTLQVDDKGTITAWYQDKPYFVGFLNIEHETEEVIRKAIARIVDRSQIKRKKK